MPSMNKMRLLNFLLCASVVLLVLFMQLCLPIPPASAASDNASKQASAERMQALKLIQGRDGGLDLDANLSRAELVTIIVRAYGQEGVSQLWSGRPSFRDVQRHWASGYIALAQDMIEKNGGSLGLPDGTFNPDGKVTTGEVLTLLMKFLGVKPDPTQPWPNDYLQGARNAGLLTADDHNVLAAIINNAATRGEAFSLADQAFASFKLSNGKTVYTTYVDTEAVKDLAANVTAKTGTDPYLSGAPKTIQVNSITVAAGQTIDVQATVKDKDGTVLSDIPLEGRSDVGTYEKGKFTAGAKSGTGTLTLIAGEIQATANITILEGSAEKLSADLPAASRNSTVARTIRPKVIVFDPIPDQQNKEGDSVNFQVNATGDEILSYEISGLPDGITIDKKTGIVSGTIGYKTVTVYQFTVTQETYSNLIVEATGRNVKGTQFFNWTIDNVDTSPVMAPIMDKTSKGLTYVEAYVNASDVDGDTLRYSWDGENMGLTLDHNTGKISGIIQFPLNSKDNFIITVTVRDNTPSEMGQFVPKDQATTTFKWTVVE